MKLAIYQVLFASVIALCFAVVFNVRGKKLIVSALGGGFAWAAYLALYALAGSMFLSIFTTALLSSLLSELLARKLRAPVTVFLVPMLIPIFPGGDLYYAAASLVRDDGSFSKAAALVLKEAGAIAGGIIVAATLVQIYYRIKFAKYAKRRR